MSGIQLAEKFGSAESICDLFKCWRLVMRSFDAFVEVFGIDAYSYTTTGLSVKGQLVHPVGRFLNRYDHSTLLHLFELRFDFW